MKFNFKVISNYKKWFIISSALIGIGLLMMLIFGFNLGNDFQGGTKIQIKFNTDVSESQIKEDISSFNLSPDITSAGSLQDEIIIKTSKQLDLAERRAIYEHLANKYNLKPEDNALRASELIGPTIGDETKANALKAFLYASIGMLIYITFRFEWKFGVAAIISVVHDVLALCAVYIIFRIPLTSSFIAAILTVVGYSINDTIVVFDRIREELKYSRTSNLERIADNSINMTLRRTINTSLTTIVVIIALLIFGVDDIKLLALPLALGIIIGTYSSIFIAAPAWVLLEGKSKRK